MKQISFLLALSLFAASVLADHRVSPDGMGGWVVEDTGGCGGLFGAAQGACMAQQQLMQQQQIRQQQLLQQQKIENQRLQNESLKRSLERDQSTPQYATQESQGGSTLQPEFRDWQAANPWFGSDRAKTEFAMFYAKQLRQERPDLVGRPFFDKVTTKIQEVFGPSR